MPLAVCTITGTIYDVNGSAVSGVHVYVDKMKKSGQILQHHRTRVATSDVNGLISFAVPRSSTIWLSGQFFIGPTSYHVNGGVMLAVPDAATATLTSLESLPTEGVIVKSDGTALANLIGTLNFSNDFTVTESSTGVALIEIAIAAGITDEQVQDALATFFPDSGGYDWTYDDAGNRVSLVIAVATTSVAGLMSAADKTAVDALGVKNAANGYAGLNASGLLTESQIPSSIARDSETTAAIDAEAAIRAGADAALQPLDSDLTAIAALAPSNDDVIQRKAGAWTNRTPAQVKTDLALVKGDVGLGNVDNTSDANKPVSTATQAALDLKANDADVVHDTGNETIAGVKTFSSDPIIPDEAYGAGWNGSLEPPTKNAVFDKIETLGGGGAVEVPDGTLNDPSIYWLTGAIKHGFYKNTSYQITYGNNANGNIFTFTNNDVFRFASNIGLAWSSTTDSTGGSDAGVFRSAARRVKATDGSNSTLGDFEARQYYIDQTITAAGTTGDRTINKAAGTVNIAASGTSVTVTNSLVTTSSLVFAVIRTNDSTATIKNVVPSNGSFVITLSAAATAEVSIGFIVINQ